MKKLISMLLSVLFVASALHTIAFAYGEKGFFKPTKVGDYTIVYTERYSHAAPRTGIFYLYGKCGVLDKDGVFVVEPIYDHIYVPQNGRARFMLYSEEEQRSKYGYFDGDWNIAIEPIYNYAYDFSEGLAAVSAYDGYEPQATYGYINTEGETVIPFIYNTHESAKDGKVSVGTYDIGWCYRRYYSNGTYDTSGNLLEPVIYRHENVTHTIAKTTLPVSFDGVPVDNYALSYPIVADLNNGQKPYLPLTYDICRALGINVSWTQEAGLELDYSGEYASEFGYGECVMPDGTDTAEVFTGTITMNGIKYSNDDAFAPLLVYKDIIYFPLEWWTGLGKIHTYYNSTKEDGIMITTKW